MSKSMGLMLRRLWRHILPRRRIQFCFLFLLMILSSFAEIVSIGSVLPFLGVLTSPENVFTHRLSKPIIELLDITNAKELLLPLTFAFAVASVFSGAMRLILLWAQTQLGHAIGADLSISAYRRTLYQPYSVHLTRNSSETIAGISIKTSLVVYQTLLPFVTILSSCLMLLTILGALIIIQPMVAFTAFGGFGLIYALVILITKQRLIRDSEHVNRESNHVLKVLQEGLGGIRDVLIDGTQDTYCKIYRNSDLLLRGAQANIQFIGSSPRFGIEALGMVLISVLAFTLAGRPEGLSTAIPVMGALALGAQRLLPVLQQAYSSWSSMRGGQASLNDTLVLLDQPLPQHAEEPLPEPMPFTRDIRLNNLQFRYASESPFVLNGVSLTIAKGSRVGFIGGTGSGKSTLSDIVMGLLFATEGSLLVDDVTITEKNHRAWQTHVAHVPQTIFLADTSIAENIAFGIPIDEIDFSRVKQAAEKAQISQTIEGWEDKYKTLVGERGVRISGGQRQRIGIARALYKRADFIVFDEATSALDNDTERSVMEAIENLGDQITLIIIAHRLSTLQKCTVIYKLSDGAIESSGSFEQIVRTN